jgi:thiamine pyrophosphokinase
MRGILLLNGDPYVGEIDTHNAIVYCCDGAYLWAHGKVKIDKNIGDFDSLKITPDPLPEEVYPAEKNFTDGEAALFALLNAGVTSIEIYGGFGGREDHFVGNLHLLHVCAKRGIPAFMQSQNTTIYAACGTFLFDNMQNQTVSVFPFGGQLHILNSSGLKYPYPKVLSYGECRGVSNVVLNSHASLSWQTGEVALIFVNRSVV